MKKEHKELDEFAEQLETDEIERDRELERAKADAKTTDRKYKRLLKELEQADSRLRVALEIRDRIKPIEIKARKRNGRGEATALAVGSDWHMGALVRPKTVNGMNEVTPEITWERIERFFRNVLKLVKKEAMEVDIKNLVLALLGDFIENTIHLELLEDCTLSPIEQMRMVQDAISGGIDYLLKEGDFEQILIPTASGNHGRSTDKVRAQTEYKNSYEQLMYLSLARHYKDEKRVKFQIEDGYFNYLKIYNETIRFHHGHACKFGGGIGGLLVPMRRFIHRANQQRQASASICGHFHSLLVDYDIMINGSLIGPTAYSMRLGFPPERPQQIFRLIDSDRGFTGFFPILVDK